MRVLPPILVYAVICLLSSRQASTFPKIAPDYVAHFLEYAALGFFSIRVYTGKLKPRVILFFIPVMALLAFLDELHQYFVPTRFFEIKDILVDVLGALCGALAYHWSKGPRKRLRNRLPKRFKRPAKPQHRREPSA